MSIWYRMKALLGHGRVIRLQGEAREGGYTFVRSPDLPGFNFMLEPGEEEDIHTIMDALYGPLAAYLKAEMEAAAPAAPIKLKGVIDRSRAPQSLVADLCYA